MACHFFFFFFLFFFTSLFFFSFSFLFVFFFFQGNDFAVDTSLRQDTAALAGQ